MTEKTLAVFEGRHIRRHYDEKAGIWYFSIVDIVQVLIQQPDFQVARNYWKVLKNRLNKEGSESVTKCNRLKMEAADGKKYLIPFLTQICYNSLTKLEVRLWHEQQAVEMSSQKQKSV